MNWIRNIFFMTAGKCMSILRCMVSQFLYVLLSIEKYHTKTLIISSRKKILLRLKVNDSGSHLLKSPSMVRFSFQIFDIVLKVNDSGSHLLKSPSMDVVSCDVINA